MSNNTWIMTASGRHFDYESCKLDSIVIEDIAVALSNLCRFAGHCDTFYSVAEHSVLVSYLVDQSMKGAAYAALMHDAEEAYCCDIPCPLKKAMRLQDLPRIPSYQDISQSVDAAIHKKFKVYPRSIKANDAIHAEVKHCDLLACLLEGERFFGLARLKEWHAYSDELLREAHERRDMQPFIRCAAILHIDLARSPKESRKIFMRRFNELSKTK